NVTEAVASGADTTGLDTVIQFSALPSLVIYTSTFNTPTIYFAIEWPNQPAVFVLQQSDRLGSNATWQTVTNARAPRYFFPVESTRPAAFYRLLWSDGQPLQNATVLVIPGGTLDSLPTKLTHAPNRRITFGSLPMSPDSTVKTGSITSAICFP